MPPRQGRRLAQPRQRAGPASGFASYVRPKLRLTCALAFPKGKRSQPLAEALSELGVARLVPLSLSRCQQQPPSRAALSRWSLEAMKQCGRNHKIEIGEPCDLQGLIALGAEVPLRLLCDTGSAPPLRELLSRFSTKESLRKV